MKHKSRKKTAASCQAPASSSRSTITSSRVLRTSSRVPTRDPVKTFLLILAFLTTTITASPAQQLSLESDTAVGFPHPTRAHTACFLYRGNVRAHTDKMHINADTLLIILKQVTTEKTSLKPTKIIGTNVTIEQKPVRLRSAFFLFIPHHEYALAQGDVACTVTAPEHTIVTKCHRALYQVKKKIVHTTGQPNHLVHTTIEPHYAKNSRSRSARSAKNCCRRSC